MKGTMGKILYIDLSLSTLETRSLHREDWKKYIGGSGIGAKILYEETDEKTSPLGPENVLIFMTGPFTGTPVLCSSRYSVVSKSPLTGIFGESNSGGSWAEMLKRSGFDGLVFKGRAPAPVYLWVNNGQVALNDAGHLWGKDTFETDALLKTETEGKAVVACIGPAGERCVPMAAIMNDGTDARAAGRCGLGAVMGSKNLKAVVVFGKHPIEVMDLEAFEKGIITEKDTNGVRLIWGHGDAMVAMVELIGRSKGIGKILGLGVREAARRLGKNADEFAMHVKGLELPAHDPRAYNAGAVNYGTAARGACHLAGFSHTFERVLAAPEIDLPKPMNRFKVSGKGILSAKTQNYVGMLDALEICKFILFGGIGISTFITWYRDVTGEAMDVDTFMRTGERIFNLKRMYNVRCGISRKDDFLPPRMLTWQKTGKGLSRNLPPLGKMLGEYYRGRGWSEEGIPSKEKIKKLALEV